MVICITAGSILIIYSLVVLDEKLLSHGKHKTILTLIKI